MARRRRATEGIASGDRIIASWSRGGSLCMTSAAGLGRFCGLPVFG